MQTTTQDNLTREEAAERAALVTSPVYEIWLDLTTGDQVFGSRTKVRFGSDQPGSDTFIDLTGATVERATLNGRDIPEDHFDGNRLRLSGLEETNELEVWATCSYRRTGSGLHFFRDPVDKEPYLHTQFEPFEAHSVFACFDQPDIKGRFSFFVEAPEGWEICSNMAPTARPAAGGLWAFPQTPVMPSYITAVVAGPFHIVRDRHRDIDLGIWCRRSLADHLDPDEIFEITKQGFDFFEEAFGSPYPFGKYDQLFVPEFKFGAMENAGCVTFTESYVFRSRVTETMRQSRAGTILHEMAHMWFGDLVTMRWWDDLWLNESFATYTGNLATERATRFKTIWAHFASGTKGWAYTQDQLPTTHPIVADMPDVQATHLNFDGITYAKGASVLKQFAAWAGEEAFLEGVRRYFEKHAWGNTTLADFMAPIEQASGRDLGAWGREWLQTTGVNTIRLESTDSDGAYTQMSVVQTAPEEHPTLRSHRMAIGFYDLTEEGLVRRKRIELDVTGERTEVPQAVGDEVPDLLLPNDDDLTYAKIRLDERSLRTLVSRLRELHDPVAKALCWTATWDMTRDAEMSARDFVDLVCNNLTPETDIAVVQGQMLRLGVALGYYVHPDARDASLDRAAAAAREAVLTYEPGSDHQHAWARFLFSVARSQDDVALLRGLLDGSREVTGLTVDTDTRWAIVSGLAGWGNADEALISAEYERDPTDMGRRHAEAARASRPTESAKAEAWDRATNDPDISLADMKALLSGFADPMAPELLRPYRDPYFATVTRFFDTRGIDFGLQFAESAYPRWLVEQETVDATRAYLAGDDVPPPLRRIMLEAMDGVARAMRARERDRA
ncbi:MAG TPA: aminopeptidase N [Actinomycetota bacterium]|nr:aminopeptidase N [Actinomycetota bacterium]